MRREHVSDEGFSLLELVVVVAIFALVAVMSAQALQGTLRSQERLAAQSRKSAGLSLGLARLRLDLESAVPLTFRDENGVGQPALLVGKDSRQLGLSVAGQGRLEEEPGAGLGRVEWRLDSGTGQIMRRFWPTLMPGRAAAAGAETMVMADVRDLQISTYSKKDGWTAGWRPDADDPAALPLALRVVIETGNFGRLELLERL